MSPILLPKTGISIVDEGDGVKLVNFPIEAACPFCDDARCVKTRCTSKDIGEPIKFKWARHQHNTRLRWLRAMLITMSSEMVTQRLFHSHRQQLITVLDRTASAGIDHALEFLKEIKYGEAESNYFFSKAAPGTEEAAAGVRTPPPEAEDRTAGNPGGCVV